MPFGGFPIHPIELAGSGTTGQVMQFVVGPVANLGMSTPSQDLVLPRWLPAGLYVRHCHIVEHEDNEMMRPYCVGGQAICPVPIAP